MTIALITKRDAIREARREWLELYEGSPDDIEWSPGLTLATVKARVQALDPETCTVQELGAALGVGWTDFRCSECRQEQECLVAAGHHPDSPAWKLCQSCAEKLLAAFSSPRRAR